MKTKIFLICNLLICNLVIAQNITNTLGTSGVFKIKDGSTDYLSLNQSTGQVNILKTLRLENTSSSTTGIIFKGVDKFLHNYKPFNCDGYNTFLGINAGNFTMSSSFFFEASFNTGIGFNSLSGITTGYENTAVGYWSLLNNNTGYENTALGTQSLRENTAGYQNTAVGYQSLYNNTAGHENTAVGHEALFFATGNFNTALGYLTGNTVFTGSNLTLIGYNAQATSGSAANQITLGNNQVTSLRCNVTTITSLSDARDKKNITDLSLGINFLMKLKPRLYNWDKREWYDDNVSDGSKMQEAPTAGFIAQELDELQRTENAEYLNLVLKDNPEKWEATPGNLFPIVVKAIQDLKSENDELKEKLAGFEQTQQLLVSEIEKLKSKSNETKEVKLGEK